MGPFSRGDRFWNTRLYCQLLTSPFYVLDTDECAGSMNMCPGFGQYCLNTEGSYKCMCKANFFMENNACKEGRCHDITFTFTLLRSANLKENIVQ